MSSSAIAQLITCLACMLMVQQAAYAARIKISIPEGYSKEWHRMKRLGSQTSCDDVVEVARSSLILPGRLNVLDNRVKFWRSVSARNNLEVFQTMAVPGLGGTTVGEVFGVLRDASCFPFFFGGAVRDQFLGREPNDADVEVDCTKERLLEVCIQNWGSTNCQSTSSIVHIGNAALEPDLEEIDLASTDSTFYSPLNFLEYTVNSMAYDVNGNDVIIDLTGTGKTDVCNRKIRIPSVDSSIESWDLWVEEPPGKPFRFWKLRAKGLTAYNDATMTYIVQNSRDLIDSDPGSFAKFYCKNVFQSTYNSADNTCQVSSSECQDGLANANIYNTVFAEDFGDYWTTVIVPNVLPGTPGCEPSGAVCITGKAWLLTCGVLLYHGVTTFR